MAQSGVTFALPFCRNHTIWRMSRVWHQPSQVGKAYDWFQWWNCLGSSEPVSDHPGVTVATLCWVFGTQQSMVFCCLFWFVTTVVTLPIFIELGKFFIILPHYRIFPLSVGILLLPNHCFGMHGVQNNWITEIQFYFWFCQDLFILQYSTALKTSVLNYLEFFCKILVKSTASTLIRNNCPYLISNFYFKTRRLLFFSGPGMYPLVLCSLGHIITWHRSFIYIWILMNCLILAFFQFSWLFKSELF